MLTLAPRTDFDVLREILATTGRVHVPNILDDASAKVLWSAASGDVDWALVFNHREKTYDLRTLQFDALSDPARAALVQAVADGGRTDFQYAFDSFRVSDAAETGAPQPMAFRALYDLLNGPALETLRALTGDPRITYLDLQATRYRPGHFLTVHDDNAEGKNRLYAFVLNMTPSWRIDWGGLLLFEDARGHVSGGFTPAFNALNVFRVPQPHAVSMVAPFAGGARYAFTGWMRSAKGPA